MTKKFALMLLAISPLMACSQQRLEAVRGIALQTVQDISCKDQKFETNLWDGLKTFLLENNKVLQSDDFREALQKEVDQIAKKNPKVSAQKVVQLKSDLDLLINTLLEEAPRGERVETAQQLLLLISAIDVGDRSTDFRAYIHSKVRGDFQRLHKTIQAMELNCEAPLAPSEPKDGSSEAQKEPNKYYEFHKNHVLNAGGDLAAFGGRWAFATNYQTCQSIQLPNMAEQTASVQGITITGKHPDGVGNRRIISSLSDVQRTHYYLQAAQNSPQECFNTFENPLIYDYGGKPYATTALNAEIDLFKNSGNGTKVLGIDCSAYVFTSLATAGLRLQAGRPLKASDSWAWGSSAYVEPQENGLTCLKKITVSPVESLKAGDIVAVRGHVFLIDKAGQDPFGIKEIKTESECLKVDAKNFDFVVAQSSPSKGGVGVNYFEARSYLPTNAKIRDGLEEYAMYSCMARLRRTSYTPNLGNISVVRHKGTPECFAPRVKLAREACVQSCPTFVR